MMYFSFVIGILLSGYAMASRLYAASYAGTVTELRLSKPGLHYHLAAVSHTNECGTSPSWLMVDRANGILYCLDEAVDFANATLSSLKMNSNGSLATVQQLQTVAGPVSSTFYTPAHAPDRQFLALAHYSGSAITTYSVDPIEGTFNRSQTLTFTMSNPGPVSDRQDVPHIHEVLVDPTGRFLLAPDLGSDLVRIFHINPTTGRLMEQQPLVTSPGSGPRHGAFWFPQMAGTNISENSRFYLVSELDNYLRGYDVTYSPNGTMLFSQFYECNTYGGVTPPAGSTAAEIAISPSNDRLLVSNRGDNTFGHGNDSIAIFSLPDSMEDEISFLGLYPAYGSSPRHFEFSPDGDMLAVALQNSHQVAIIGWDAKRGAPGSLLADVTLDGEIPTVVWGLGLDDGM
ncbi:hypothetical protein ASPVEDRAFT_61359 [Aspergillus versicolor CBS 583.65]|uniref:Uncharacterized protein n=1 Tax=Aspergillus versicolor CBS 583.65 TaxID=1036611 RepID=A0A1L9PGV1_ASPVE|nr:uncharacterized protein ASPVEDRAFT_61359 [Aspergillus versicolor CBS 583.65]OJJ00741.1 hypothetical protein ASPVEDRAFT_61359 [Aspergillus versicolor CBS 583.65]